MHSMTDQAREARCRRRAAREGLTVTKWRGSSSDWRAGRYALVDGAVLVAGEWTLTLDELERVLFVDG